MVDTRSLVAGALVAAVTVLCAAPTEAQFAVRGAPLAKRIVADYGYWSKDQTPPYAAAQIPFAEITHVIHAGLVVDRKADGSIDVPAGLIEPALMSDARAAGVKVMILVGGSAATFGTVAATVTLRAALVANLAAFVGQYGYDGVDIDWEYPTTQSDRRAYTGLMRDLRGALPAPGYLLSADVPPWGGRAYDFSGVEPLLDFFNIMMYDVAGPWTNDGQLNSPIFDDPANPEPQGNARQAIDKFTNVYHLAAEKLNMGTPFYGYEYRNVAGLYKRCKPCNGKTVLSEPYGTYIEQRVDRDGWIEAYDRAARVPYLLRRDGKPGFITYDDAASTYERVSYSVWGRGLGGTFMWSVDQDYDGHSQVLLDAMYDAVVAGSGAEHAPLLRAPFR